LPAWLTFDPVTRSFSGTPSGADTGVLNVRVIASDHGQNDAHIDFTLRVLGLPVALPPGTPPAIDPLPPALPGDVAPMPETPRVEFISDPANEGLKNESLGQGPVASDGGSFDARGIPGGATDQGRERVAVEAPMQVAGLTRPDGFRIFVEPSSTHDISLLLVRPLNDQFSKPSEQISMSIPADTFVHTTQDAVISLSASRLNGAKIPAWLKFDAVKGEFRGSPPDGFDGDLEIKVTARDNFGNEVSTVFRFRVHAIRPKASFVGKEGLSQQIRAQTGLHTRVGSFPQATQPGRGATR
jgi:hypothetical protein